MEGLLTPKYIAEGNPTRMAMSLMIKNGIKNLECKEETKLKPGIGKRGKRTNNVLKPLNLFAQKQRLQYKSLWHSPD